jgi:hypothetical protein
MWQAHERLPERPASSPVRRSRKRRRGEGLAGNDARFSELSWIRSTLHPELEALFARVGDLCATTVSELGLLLISAKVSTHRCVLRSGRVSMNIDWKQPFMSDARRDAMLVVRLFSGPLIVPGEAASPNDEDTLAQLQPEQIARRDFAPSLRPEGEICWVEAGAEGAALSREEIARHLVRLFFKAVFDQTIASQALATEAASRGCAQATLLRQTACRDLSKR